MKRIYLICALIMLAAGSAAAQPADWRECAGPPGARGPVILPPWCTVDIEHHDRMARLRRLSEAEGLAEAPEFYEYKMKWRELGSLLRDFPADVPVLRVVFPERVLFDVDRADLKSEAAQVVDIVADALSREPPDVALFVAGHTDATASDAYNFNLSLRRADTVARALMERGVGLTSIFRVGFGEAVPVASNAGEAGRRANRRVEFIFAARPEAAAAWLARQAAETCYAADASALAKCRKTVAVAVEVVRADVERLPDRSVKTAIRAPTTAIAPPARRSYTVDLGTRSVVIDMPKR